MRFIRRETAKSWRQIGKGLNTTLLVAATNCRLWNDILATRFSTLKDFEYCLMFSPGAETGKFSVPLRVARTVPRPFWPATWTASVLGSCSADVCRVAGGRTVSKDDQEQRVQQGQGAAYIAVDQGRAGRARRPRRRRERGRRRRRRWFRVRTVAGRADGRHLRGDPAPVDSVGGSGAGPKRTRRRDGRWQCRVDVVGRQSSTLNF